MRKLLKIIGGLFLLGMIGIGVGIYLKKDLNRIADNFFMAIKKNNYQLTQKYLSKNFKANTSIEQLKMAFPYSKFKNYQGSAFSTVKNGIENRGFLRGTLQFKDGSAMPIEIYFIKENNTWKINKINLLKNITQKKITIDNCGIYQTKGKYIPGNVPTFLNPSSKKVFLTCEVKNVPLNITILSQWYYYKPDGNKILIATYPFQINQNNYVGHLTTYLEVPDKKNWPLGNYEIDLTVQGKTIKTIDFQMK